MERQTKHRILGILVVVGLVIILLPLFQGGKDMTTEAALVKAPPFPDQTEQVAVNTPEPMPANPLPAVATESTVPAPSAEQPADLMSAAHPSIVSNPAEVTTAAATPTPVNTTPAAPAEVTASAAVEPASVQIPLSHSEMVQSEMAANQANATATPATTSSEPVKTSNYRIIEGEKAASILKKSARVSKNTHSPKLTKQPTVALAKSTLNTNLKSVMNAPIDDDGLLKLKSAVWVIQIGSFKNKAGALSMVNRLRSNGYRAFIQQFPTSNGVDTRVYVGPEDKRMNANALADRLDREMHIQGMLISYKPLTL